MHQQHEQQQKQSLKAFAAALTREQVALKRLVSHLQAKLNPRNNDDDDDLPTERAIHRAQVDCRKAFYEYLHHATKNGSSAKTSMFADRISKLYPASVYLQALAASDLFAHIVSMRWALNMTASASSARAKENK
jgi:hypothetical protein